MTKKIAVFLDRDGTISEEKGYINHLDRYELLPNTPKAVKKLNDNSILAITVTNQAGVARGYFTEELLGKVLKKMEDLIEAEGAKLDAVYYCPHHPSVGPEKYRKDCNCRKPKTGMLDMAQKDFDIDMTNSYMVGDRINDIYFGHKAGLKSVLVLTGYGKGEYEYQKQDWKEQPDYIAQDLLDAVEWILKDIKKI